MPTLAILIVVTALAGLGLLEWRRHRTNLSKIPLRVHVNGTRGKSSVVRLIAAGLREGGIRTMAKTTGSRAMLILPDGSELPIPRTNNPNVIEQLRIVSTAAAIGVDAFVVECMAVDPMLQALSELQLVQATHGVITNVGPDHLEVMGPTETNVAEALAGAVPRNARLFTAERSHLAVVARAAADRNCTLIPVESEQIRGVSLTDLRGFHHIEHSSNVALALRVCQDLGVPREVALRGMWRSTCDVGAMSLHHLLIDHRHLVFVNCFGANDIRSSELCWRLMDRRMPKDAARIALINCRSDRPYRSRELGRAAGTWLKADRYFLMGGAVFNFARVARHSGVPRADIETIADRKPLEVFQNMLTRAVRNPVWVIGLGNIAGPGSDLVDYCREHEVRGGEE